MKNLLFLFFLNLSLFSQKGEATLYLRDGCVLKGIAIFRNFENKVKYLKDNNSKPIIYDFIKLDRLIVDIEGKKEEFQYKILNGEKPRLFRVKKRGDIVSLYFLLYETNNNNMRLTHTEYYVGISNNDNLEQITFNRSLFSKKKKFKKKASTFFKNCNMLVKKIKNEELKMSDIIEIVDFYNHKCNHS